MSATKTTGYRRIAAAAGIAMALGPLTALSLASLDRGYTTSAVANTSGTPLQAYNSTRDTALEYAGKQLSDVAAGSGSLDLFNGVLAAAGMKELLRGQEQYTVFIPVNEAFATLGGERLSSALDNAQKAERLAKAHVVPGRVTTTDLMADTRLRSLNGREITAWAGADLMVNGARVIGTELAENGIVHFVDRIL